MQAVQTYAVGKAIHLVHVIMEMGEGIQVAIGRYAIGMLLIIFVRISKQEAILGA